MNHTEKRKFTLLSVLALVALGIAAYLTRHFYEVRGGVAGFQSLCNFGSHMNCDVVAASRFAELLPGIPLSTVAGGWYLAIAIVALYGRNVYWRREATRAVFALTAVSVIGSVIYTLIMAFVLKTWCLFCLGAHALDLVMFGIAWSLKPDGFAEHAADKAKWRTFAGWTVGSVVFIALAFLAFNPLSMDDRRATSIADVIAGTAPVAINVKPESNFFGKADAKVVITEFLDFQCPSCRLGAQAMHSVLSRFPDQIKLVLRNFPLDGSCNPNMQPGYGHPAACEAAKAVHCASKQGRFQEAYEDLFSHQESLGPNIPTERIKAIAGIDGAKLDECIKSAEVSQFIADDIREGATLGVRSTPTFFLNGRKVEGVYPVPVWAEAIERELKGGQ
jgi:protein-disulfide isomerase/uncharacterized membrane protein